MYAKGSGVDRDQDEAFRLFRMAADQGHVQAAFRGEMREKGWARRPALAMRNAGTNGCQGWRPGRRGWLRQLYEEGYGVDKDLKKAVTWYRQAAEKGMPDAEFRLALLIERGQGVTKDDMEALKWYFAAADQGCPA